MASKYSEYSRLRSIARKRAERLSEAGLSKLITFPSVKELKAQGIAPAQAVKQVERFLEAPTQTRQYRRMDEQQRPVFIREGTQVVVTEKAREKTERRKAQNRESARRYREKVKEVYSSFTNQEKALLKAARTLGLHVTPAIAKAYIEYVEYRFSYGSSKMKYRIATYVEEFQDLLVKRGKNNMSDTMRDFAGFMKDRRDLSRTKRGRDNTRTKRNVNEYGYTGEQVDDLMHDFIYG